LHTSFQRVAELSIQAENKHGSDLVNEPGKGGRHLIFIYPGSPPIRIFHEYFPAVSTGIPIQTAAAVDRLPGVFTKPGFGVTFIPL